MSSKSCDLKNIDGIILLNKPEGLTSNAALQRVKRLFSAKKAGHTGSLDPLATGMLPICLGEATKISQYLLDADKCYEVVGLLGQTTTTGDAIGDVISEIDAAHCTERMLQDVLPQFKGLIQQVPPMYSALKHQGTPLYKFARKGVVIERPARQVNIYDIQLTRFENSLFSLRVTCSKGTYIRSLVESIGDALHVGAHVTVLHRLYTAGLEQERMFTLEELEQFSSQERIQALLPTARGIRHIPIVVMTEMDVHILRQGQLLQQFLTDAPVGLVQLHDKTGSFIGLGELKSDGTLQPKRLAAF
jgi:tRNA pseudouridine55 synthase